MKENLTSMFPFLVEDIFNECIANGYSEDAAIGKVKYELGPMTENDGEMNILHSTIESFLKQRYIARRKVEAELGRKELLISLTPQFEYVDRHFLEAISLQLYKK